MALFNSDAIAKAVAALTLAIKSWHTSTDPQLAKLVASVDELRKDLRRIADVLSRPGPARSGRLMIWGPHDRFTGGGSTMKTTILDTHSYTIGLDPAGFVDAIGAPAPAPSEPSVLTMDRPNILESRPNPDDPEKFDIQAKFDGTGQPAVNQPVQVTITKGSVSVTDGIDVGGDAAVSGRFLVSDPKDRF